VLSVNRKQLIECLKLALLSVPKTTSLAILRTIKLSIADKDITVESTNLDQWFKGRIDGHGDGENSVCVVDGRLFFNVIKSLENTTEINLTYKDNFLYVNYQSLLCGIIDNYPTTPEVKQKKGLDFTFKTKTIQELIRKTRFAVATDETRTCLCGLNLEISKTGVKMTATDGHRCASHFVKEPMAKELESAILPRGVLDFIGKLQSDGVTLVYRVIVEKDNDGKKTGEIDWLDVIAGAMELTAKLIDRPYPDVNRVIPKDNPKTVIVNKQALTLALKACMITANVKTYLIKCTFSSKELVLAVDNTDLGTSVKKSVPVEYTGGDDGFRIGFNGESLLEILSYIDTYYVKMTMNTAIIAVLIYPYADAKDEMYLQMPLKILEG